MLQHKENSKAHHLDNPACELIDGNKFWYANDEFHRLDGPACEYADGDIYWFVNGEDVSSPLGLLKHGANWKDLVEWMTPREIAICRNQL